MRFTKMHGTGNDYVYVDCTKRELAHPAEIARLVSDRHKGIGSDGLILIQRSDQADFRMEMYNADGSMGKMCGNGIRCVAKYVYDQGLTEKTQICVDTLSGIKTLQLKVREGRTEQVQVNMGEPILRPEEIPVRPERKERETFSESLLISTPIWVNGRDYAITCVSMGNPHGVVFLDEVESLKLEEIGPLFEHHSWFPEGVNTEFIQVLDRKQMCMRVWERGSGETMACGTGACAAAVASSLNGYTDRQVTVHLLGGDLEIEWREQDNCVYMTGPAVTVFTGEIDLGELE